MNAPSALDSSRRAAELELGPEWAALELLALGLRSAEDQSRFETLIRLPELRLVELYDQALRHRLLARLALHLDRPSLRGCFPAVYMSELRTTLQANRYRLQLLRQEAVRVARWFEDAGIQFVYTKGIVFESLLYDGDGTRTMVDLDLLIAPEDRPLVIDLMHTAGFEIAHWDYHEQTLVPEQPAALLEFGPESDHLPPFTRATGDLILPRVNVDIGTCFTWASSPWQLPLRDALTNRVRHVVPGTGAEVPVLAPAFQFLFTLFHLFKDAWLTDHWNSGQDVTLSKFSDVAQLWLRQREAIIAGDFSDIARRYQLSMPIVWVLAHLDRTLGTDGMAALDETEPADEDWLASARGPEDLPLRFRGSMQERLASRNRAALLEPSLPFQPDPEGKTQAG